MSEKSLRGAGPGADQAPDPAAPSGGRSSDSGAAPIEPWSGDRTERVSGRESSGPRVTLVPAVSPDSGKNDGKNDGKSESKNDGKNDGKVDGPTSTPDTRRIDSGRTTLMGVPSPMAEREKPTSPGHDVHLPSEKARPAGTRPVTSNGVIPEVELDPSSTRRIGKIEPPGQPSTEAPAQTPVTAGTGERKDSKAGAAVPNDRSMAAAAATFRAAARGADKPTAGAQEPDRSTDRGGWTADRTQEFHLDTEPPSRAFAKTLSIGIALAVGLGVLVQSFIHSRVRGGAELAELPHPPVALPGPPSPLPENVVPPPAVEATNAAPQPMPPLAGPEAAVAPEAQPAPEVAQPAEAADEVVDPADDLKAEHKTAPRMKALAPAGRPAPSARTPRAANPVARPGLSPEPVPSPTSVAPTTPPALSATQPEKPAPKAAAPRTEPATKPYDPDMPLPPSME